MQHRPHPGDAARPSSEDAFLREWMPVVAAWCARLGGRGVDVEEACHDVLLTVLRRRDAVRSDVELGAYVYGVTRRVVANHRRRVWWRRWIPGAPADPVSATTPLASLEQQDVATRVQALLEALPDRDREVLVLCDVEERSASEVAVLLGVPEGTIRSRLRTARARFRERAHTHHLHPPEEDP
jgi:RNA polymerase sigma-70 factor (ECF subfamily)